MNGDYSRSASSSLSSSTRSGIHTPVPGPSRDSDLKSTLLASLEISKEVKRLHSKLETKVEEHERRFVLQEARIHDLEEQAAKVQALEREVLHLKERAASYEKLGEAFESMKVTLDSLLAVQAEKTKIVAPKVQGVNGHTHESEEEKESIPTLKREESSSAFNHRHPSTFNAPVSPPSQPSRVNGSNGVNGSYSTPSSTAMSPSSSLSSSTSKRVSFAEPHDSPKPNGFTHFSSESESKLTNGAFKSIGSSDPDNFESDLWKPIRPEVEGYNVSAGPSSLSPYSPYLSATKKAGNGAADLESSPLELHGLDTFASQFGLPPDAAKPAVNGFSNTSISPTKSRLSGSKTDVYSPPAASTSKLQSSQLPLEVLEELEELREFKSTAISREETLKTELKLIRSRKAVSSGVGKEDELNEREEKLQEMQSVLMEEHKRQTEERKNLTDWEARLTNREMRLKKTEKLCQDHMEELEKRLKVVQKREAKIDQDEGISDMRRREPSFSARDAAQFRKEQSLNFKAKELDRRAEEMTKAEQEWCKKTGQFYVKA